MMIFDHDFKKGLRALVLERLSERSALKIEAERQFIQINIDASKAAVEALRKQMDLPPCPPDCDNPKAIGVVEVESVEVAHADGGKEF